MDILRGKEVDIILDNHAPDVKLVEHAVHELKGAAKCVKLIDLKQMIPKKDDASDLIAHMGS